MSDNQTVTLTLTQAQADYLRCCLYGDWRRLSGVEAAAHETLGASIGALRMLKPEDYQAGYDAAFRVFESTLRSINSTRDLNNSVAKLLSTFEVAK